MNEQWVYACPVCESLETWPVDGADDEHVDDLTQTIDMRCDDCGAAFTNQTADRYDLNTDYWALGESQMRRVGLTVALLIHELHGGS